MNFFKKLLFLSLAFGTVCIHADGLLYRMYAGLFVHKTAQHPTIKKHGDKIAAVAIAIPALGILSWLGWKKYSAHQAKQWRRIGIKDEIQQRALAIAEQECKTFQDMSNAMKEEITSLNLEYEKKDLQAQEAKWAAELLSALSRKNSLQ